MTKRPPQGRGSGGRVTPSAKATEAAATEAAAAAGPARSGRGRVLRSTKPRPAAPTPPPPAKGSSGKVPSGKGSTAKGSSGKGSSGTATSTTSAKAAGSKASPAAGAKGTKGAGGRSTATKERKDRAVAVETVEEAPAPPVWGMGDVIIWWLVGFVAVAVVYQLVASWLISNGTFVPFWPNEEGWAIGEVAGRIGTGQEPAVTVGVNGAPLWLQLVLQIPLWAVLIIGPVYVAKRKQLSLRDDFGLWFKAIDAPIGLAIGVACQLIMLPVIYWVLFRIIGDQDVSAAARALTDRADGVGGVVALFLIVGFGAPIAEELFYRGLSQHAIAKRFGPLLGVLLGAAFFSLSHFQGLQFLGLFGFGLVLGALTWRFDRLGPAIFAHMGFNLTTAVVLVWNLPVA